MLWRPECLSTIVNKRQLIVPRRALCTSCMRACHNSVISMHVAAS